MINFERWTLFVLSQVLIFVLTVLDFILMAPLMFFSMWARVENVEMQRRFASFLERLFRWRGDPAKAVRTERVLTISKVQKSINLFGHTIWITRNASKWRLTLGWMPDGSGAIVPIVALTDITNAQRQ